MPLTTLFAHVTLEVAFDEGEHTEVVKVELFAETFGGILFDEELASDEKAHLKVLLKDASIFRLFI